MDSRSTTAPNDTTANQSPASETHTEFRYIEAYEDVCDSCELFNMQNAMSQCKSCGWRECRACTIETGGRRSHQFQGKRHFSPVDVSELRTQAAIDHERRVARLGGWMSMRGLSRQRGHARGWRYSRRRRGGQTGGWGRRNGRGHRGNRQRGQEPAPGAAPAPAPSPAASPSIGEARLDGAQAPETAEGAEMLYALGLEDSASRRSESGSTTSEAERQTRHASCLILAKRAREQFETQQTDRATEECVT